MDGGLIWALVLIAGIGVAAWLLRSMSGSVRQVPDRPAREDSTDVDAVLAEALERGGRAEAAVDEDDDDEGGAEVVALTSDGWAFVPDGDEVHLVPPGDPDDLIPVRSEHTTGLAPTDDPETQVLGGRGAPVNPKTGRRVTHWKPGEHLDPGDLIAARVRRGAPDHDPWRLEALGRDREYRAWRFETEEAARAALELVEQRIVRPLRDADGDAVVIGEEDFAEARRIEEETEAELANELPPDEPEEERR